jgi:hypothetical protein
VVGGGGNLLVGAALHGADFGAGDGAAGGVQHDAFDGGSKILCGQGQSEAEHPQNETTHGNRPSGATGETDASADQEQSTLWLPPAGWFLSMPFQKFTRVSRNRLLTARLGSEPRPSGSVLPEKG